MSGRPMRVLVLGGATEAAALARALSSVPISTPCSRWRAARRTLPPPIPWRIGGFGGVAGLEAYLRATNASTP